MDERCEVHEESINAVDKKIEFVMKKQDVTNQLLVGLLITLSAAAIGFGINALSGLL
jgi:hypothetical protein